MSFVRTIRQYVPADGNLAPPIAKISRAFERFRDHERLRSARYPWNAIMHRVRWMSSGAQQIAEWTERQLQLADDSWLFIAGCNNSGTTLLRKVLASHPSIRALPREGQNLTRALPRPTDLGVSRLFAKRLDEFRWTEDSNPTPSLRAKYDWARYFERRPGHLLVKSPEDTLRTRWLQHNFVPSRFILIVRSPYAVCEGTRRRSGHSIEDAAEHWTLVNDCLLSDMPHLKDHVLLKYEDFCECPDEDLQRLETSLDLKTPFGRDVLKAQRVHNIDSKASPIQNFNAKSIDRLSRADIETINRIAGPVMAKLGYEQLQISPGKTHD